MRRSRQQAEAVEVGREALAKGSRGGMGGCPSWGGRRPRLGGGF